MKRLYEQLTAGINAAAGYGSANEGMSGVRSVGAKVAHAHVVSNFVRAGCRICRRRRDDEDVDS